MELEALYRHLQEAPRDGRWMLRKVGPTYQSAIEELRRSGRPVSVKMEDVSGAMRAVYRAEGQGELFAQ
jgi:hypothetical protein